MDFYCRKMKKIKVIQNFMIIVKTQGNIQKVLIILQPTVVRKTKEAKNFLPLSLLVTVTHGVGATWALGP